MKERLIEEVKCLWPFQVHNKLNIGKDICGNMTDMDCKCIPVGKLVKYVLCCVLNFSSFKDTGDIYGIYTSAMTPDSGCMPSCITWSYTIEHGDYSTHRKSSFLVHSKSYIYFLHVLIKNRCKSL